MVWNQSVHWINGSWPALITRLDPWTCPPPPFLHAGLSTCDAHSGQCETPTATHVQSRTHSLEHLGGTVCIAGPRPAGMGGVCSAHLEHCAWGQSSVCHMWHVASTVDPGAVLRAGEQDSVGCIFNTPDLHRTFIILPCL